MFNKNKRVENSFFSLFITIAFCVFLPYLSLAQTDSTSPLNFQEDLEIFENQDENVEPQVNTETDINEEAAEIAPEIEEEEEELIGVEDDALVEDEQPEDDQEEESLIGDESDILEESDENEEDIIEDENQEEIVAEENEATENENIDSEESEEEVVEIDTETTDEIAVEDEEEIADEDTEVDIEIAEGIETDTQQDEEEDIAETDEIEIIEEDDELVGVEDDALSEEDESVTTNQQVESLISNEVNDENDNSLSQAVIQAEEVGLSASFVRLPFEESREERLARLQQDEYFDELMHISQTGVHQYKVNTSPLIGAIGLSLGVLPAPSISVGGDVTYEDIYESSTNMGFFLNYEWKIFKKIGSLSLLPEIGISWATGGGIFVPGSDAAEKGYKPKEQHTLFIVPVSVGVMYRLQYWENQMFTPFAIGGGSYFGLLEIRDDSQSFGIGATPAIYFGGGLQFLLDSLSRKAVNTLDREFGINHIYLVAELRRYIGLSGNLGFSGFVISGGVRVDF